MWIVWLEKKILQTLGIILAIIVIVVTALHFYVVNNAERLVEELVEKRSNGKLKLKVKNIKFNYFSKKVELEKVSFYSNDSLDLVTSYHFEVDNIRLKVKALLPIFTKKELRIDSIFLSSPHIEVVRLKPVEKKENKQVSIPEEMGRVYNSMLDALQMLDVDRFQFDNGEFRLVNKVQPDQQPLVITRLHFHIDNFRVDSTTNAAKFPVWDQMVFRTRNQDIIFPDGNHRLAFSRFRINIRKQLIELDSCTISGKKPGDEHSFFSIFYDTLKLTSVDFKTLYEKEIIRADSVYCVNPKIKIELSRKNKPDQKIQSARIDTLISQLTGDLQLGYIGVKNSTVDITTHRNNETTSLFSDKNNFEMRGLTIDHSQPQPVSLESFDMAINNYKTFLRDSSYFLRFDSIRLREKKILLSNFSINTEPYKDSRNIKVRHFFLTGLSWADLLFDRKIYAEQATLISPEINYVQPANSIRRKGGPITLSLTMINDIMHLKKIQVVNGTIKVKTRNHTEMLLQGASLTFNSSNFADSVSVNSIYPLIEELSFKKGALTSKDLSFNMENAFYNGFNRKMKLEKLDMINQEKTMKIAAGNIILDSVLLNDSSGAITAESISWQQATTEISNLKTDKSSGKKSTGFSLKNIRGANTQLLLKNDSDSLSVFINSLSANSISKKEKLNIQGLEASGRDLKRRAPGSFLAASGFEIKDHYPSGITNFHLVQEGVKNLVDIRANTVTLTPDVSNIINGKPVIKNVTVNEPDFRLSVKQKKDSSGKKPLPDFTINQVEIVDPLFIMENKVENGLHRISWDGTDNRVILKGVESDKEKSQLHISSLQTELSHISVINAEGKTISSKEGVLKIQASEMNFKTGGAANWSAALNELEAKNFTTDSIGKKPAEMKLQYGVVKNLLIGSESTTDLATFINKNPAFTISNLSGYMHNEKTSLMWENFSFNRKEQSISIDTFSFHPTLSRDSFIANSPWQTDYITLHTGKINVTGFDPGLYLEDSIFKANILKINSPYITAYRDKHPPFHHGIIKPMPSKLVEKIPVKLSIDTIQVTDGEAVYTELNDKTNETGIVPVKRISGDIFPIKNTDITNKDTLRIRLNFYLLDSAWVRLRTRESYFDSLSGGLLTLRMRPGSLMYLNQILPPLAGVQLQSGYLDTLSMRSIATEYLTLGEMRMHYHDLRIQVMRSNNTEKKNPVRGLFTFIANNFVIKNKNTRRTGVVYFSRTRDKSFINYYVKVALSGVASSVGAKRNKKMLKRYKKQLKELNLPPVDYD